MRHWALSPATSVFHLSQAVLFAFFLLVFHLGHPLVAQLTAGLMSAASFIEVRLARALGTDRKPRQ